MAKSFYKYHKSTRLSRCSMLLAIGTCAIIFFFNMPQLIGRQSFTKLYCSIDQRWQLYSGSPLNMCSFWFCPRWKSRMLNSKVQSWDIQPYFAGSFFNKSWAGCLCADNWSYPVRKRMGLTLSLRGHACLIGASSSGEDKIQLELTWIV